MRKFIPIFIVLFIPVANAAADTCSQHDTQQKCKNNSLECQWTGSICRQQCYTFTEESECPSAYCEWTGESCTSITCASLNRSNCINTTPYCYWDQNKCIKHTNDCNTRQEPSVCTSNPYCYWMAGMPAGHQCQSCTNGQRRPNTTGFPSCIAESYHDTYGTTDTYQPSCKDNPPPLYADSVTWVTKDPCSWIATCPPGTHYVKTTDANGNTTSECAICPDEQYNDYGTQNCQYHAPVNVTDTTSGCITGETSPQSCKSCPAGSTSYADKTKCETSATRTCPAGKYVNGNECTQCDANTFIPVPNDEDIESYRHYATKCFECPANSESKTELEDPDWHHTYCWCKKGYINYNNLNDEPKITNNPNESCAILDYITISIIANDDYELSNLFNGGYYWDGRDVFDADTYSEKCSGAEGCATQCEAGFYCEPITDNTDIITSGGNKHKCPDGYTSDPGSAELTDCHKICTAGQYATTEQINGFDLRSCKNCPDNYTSELGSDGPDDCYQICTAGQYVTQKPIPIDGVNINLRSCENCPTHFTSDEGGAELITKCYMKPNTQFCDNKSNCKTLTDIFGDDVKIYYKE